MRYIELLTKKETTAPKEKWAKDVKHVVHKTFIENEKMLNLISNQKMQLKTTRRYHFMPTR